MLVGIFFLQLEVITFFCVVSGVYIYFTLTCKAWALEQYLYLNKIIDQKIYVCAKWVLNKKIEWCPSQRYSLNRPWQSLNNKSIISTVAKRRTIVMRNPNITYYTYLKRLLHTQNIVFGSSGANLNVQEIHSKFVGVNTFIFLAIYSFFTQ